MLHSRLRASGAKHSKISSGRKINIMIPRFLAVAHYTKACKSLTAGLVEKKFIDRLGESKNV
jgi:hypothetical protein